MNSPTNTLTAHLTPDQIDDLLIGNASPEAERHIALCRHCQMERDNFLAPVASFSTASLAWSEARAHALNRDLSQHRTPFRITRTVAFACGSLLVAVLAGGNSLYQSQQSTEQVAAESAVVAPTETAPDTDQEIASDNRMLNAIDNAIAEPAPSPLALYSSAATPTGESHRQVSN